MNSSHAVFFTNSTAIFFLAAIISTSLLTFKSALPCQSLGGARHITLTPQEARSHLRGVFNCFLYLLYRQAPHVLAKAFDLPQIPNQCQMVKNQHPSQTWMVHFFPARLLSQIFYHRMFSDVYTRLDSEVAWNMPPTQSPATFTPLIPKIFT